MKKRRASQKALVVDDDPISRKILVKALEACNLVTFECSDGLTGSKLLLDNPDLSLVVTDMAMPGMSGRQIVEMIRGNASLKEIPVIMVSGVVSLREINDILNHGASRFLPKPVRVDFLKSYVQDLTKG